MLEGMRGSGGGQCRWKDFPFSSWSLLFFTGSLLQQALANHTVLVTCPGALIQILGKHKGVCVKFFVSQFEGTFHHCGETTEAA